MLNNNIYDYMIKHKLLEKYLDGFRNSYNVTSNNIPRNNNNINNNSYKTNNINNISDNNFDNHNIKDYKVVNYDFKDDIRIDLKEDGLNFLNSDPKDDNNSNDNSDFNIKYNNINKNTDLHLIEDDLNCKEEFIVFENENFSEDVGLSSNFFSKNYKDR